MNHQVVEELAHAGEASPLITHEVEQLDTFRLTSTTEIAEEVFLFRLFGKPCFPRRELTTITGQKAVATYSRKDVANFKLRKKMPIGVMVTLRRERMYEFLEKLVRVALPRIRDFKGIESKLDGRGNYTLGVQEQIIFPEINIDQIDRIQGMNITFVTSAKTDEEGYALLKAFGLPFKNAKKD